MKKILLVLLLMGTSLPFYLLMQVQRRYVKKPNFKKQMKSGQVIII